MSSTADRQGLLCNWLSNKWYRLRGEYLPIARVISYHYQQEDRKWLYEVEVEQSLALERSGPNSLLVSVPGNCLLLEGIPADPRGEYHIVALQERGGEPHLGRLHWAFEDDDQATTGFRWPALGGGGGGDETTTTRVLLLRTWGEVPMNASYLKARVRKTLLLSHGPIAPPRPPPSPPTTTSGAGSTTLSDQDPVVQPGGKGEPTDNLPDTMASVG